MKDWNWQKIFGFLQAFIKGRNLQKEIEYQIREQ